MMRLLGAFLAMGGLAVFASTVLSQGRLFLGLLLCVAALVAFAGTLANPRVAALAATGIVGLALIGGGRTMEGIGLLVLLAVAAVEHRERAVDG